MMIVVRRLSEDESRIKRDLLVGIEQLLEALESNSDRSSPDE